MNHLILAVRPVSDHINMNILAKNKNLLRVNLVIYRHLPNIIFTDLIYSFINMNKIFIEIKSQKKCSNRLSIHLSKFLKKDGCCGAHIRYRQNT